MKQWKKVMAVILMLAMCVVAVACGQSGAGDTAAPKQESGAGQGQTEETEEGETASADTEKETATDTDNPWAGLVDTSKEETIVVYVLGDKPNDYDRVMEEANKRLMELINTKLDINFIALSDYATKYPLILTGGDDVDLVYASSWCFLSEQARKGAYLELDEEFLNAYMPMTMANTSEAAWKQAKLDGKIYQIPRNQSDNQYYGGFLVRKDVMDKYGIEEIKTFDDYEQFLFTVAENETGVYAMYAFPSLCGGMDKPFMLPFENMHIIGNNLVWDSDNGTAKAEDVEYVFTTDEYKDYVLRMAEWAKRGVWPSNAINETVHSNDRFMEGMSLSIPCRVPEADNLIKQTEAKGYEVAFVSCLQDGSYTRKSAYNGDGMAIASFSKNPERAAVTLDIMKNDEKLNLLLVGGIEGVHYTVNEDGTRSTGPESDNYTWDNWTWSIRNDWNPPLKCDERVQAVSDIYTEKLMPDDMWIFDGFTADNTKYDAEVAVINSLVSEYQFSFDLGVFGDETEAKYEEFVRKLNDAGLEKVLEEWKRQIKEYVGQ